MPPLDSLLLLGSLFAAELPALLANVLLLFLPDGSLLAPFEPPLLADAYAMASLYSLDFYWPPY
jgi:hypothetical protein